MQGAIHQCMQFISLRKFFNFKIIFDMRGFWANDKVDGKIWPQNQFLYKIIFFSYYKNLEKKIS